MSRYLVAYYSWTGNTAKVAKRIAETLAADIEEIHEFKPRVGAFAFPAALVDSLLKKSAPIWEPTKSMANYDVVILGCPVWASNMATPMRSFIMQEYSAIKQVGLFCILGGSGGKTHLTRMAELCRCNSLAELIVDRSALLSNVWRDQAANFVRQIQTRQVQTTDAASSRVAAA